MTLYSIDYCQRQIRLGYNLEQSKRRNNQNCFYFNLRIYTSIIIFRGNQKGYEGIAVEFSFCLHVYPPLLFQTRSQRQPKLFKTHWPDTSLSFSLSIKFVVISLRTLNVIIGLVFQVVRLINNWITWPKKRLDYKCQLFFCLLEYDWRTPKSQKKGRWSMETIISHL